MKEVPVPVYENMFQAEVLTFIASLQLCLSELFSEY
jgi:hypothetical protein